MDRGYSSTEYKIEPRQFLVGAQMMFVAFGGLVLVPILTGLDPNVALFTAGVGTLLFQLITKGQIPVFLASSFAFIAPIIFAVGQWGIPATMSGLIAAGVFYIILSVMVRIWGAGFLHRLLPPVVTGPVIMVIGLILSPVAINMAAGKTGDGGFQLVPSEYAIPLALIALVTTVFITLKSKSVLRVMAILVGVAAGYVAALILGAITGVQLVDFSPVAERPMFGLPNFVLPEWSWAAVLFILPVAIAPAIEHFGDVIAVGGVTGKDYLDKPGIHNTLMGDGIATSFAGLLGGPPNTTYSEVTGAVALTRTFNPAIMTWAAIWAIGLSFFGKLGAILNTIPVPVMGGIMILLFGTITVVGLNSMLRSSCDLSRSRNLVIVALILTVGIGGAQFTVGGFSLGGIGLAGLVGVLLNLFLPNVEHVDEELDGQSQETSEVSL